MIELNVKRTDITVSNLGALVKGNVNSLFVRFTFSEKWAQLVRTAVFSCGSVCVAVALSSDTCAIPWEVLAVPGKLFLALRGTDNGGSVVLCSENVFLGKVSASLASEIAAEAHDPTPNIIDTLRYDVEALKSEGSGSGTYGADGSSAYEIAVEHGFDGTETQWLASLKGEDGAPGTPGQNGADGHTPVKGVDYFTAADKSEIAAAAAAAIDLGDYVPMIFGDLTGHQGNLTASDYIAVAEAPDGEAKKVSLTTLKNSITGMISASEISVYQVTPEDVGNVQDKLNELQTVIGNKQGKITANGLLKGDGHGGITAAAAGTDYMTPNGVDTKIAAAIGEAIGGAY